MDNKETPKLWYLVEKERSRLFPPIQTYQSDLEGIIQFDDAPAGSTATDWERLPSKMRETIERSSRAQFIKSLLSAFFVDEESAKAAARAKLETWNAHVRVHNEEQPDDPQWLYYTSDDIVVKCFEFPATWETEDAELKPVPQPRSCRNCALRMVEHDLDRRVALGCLVHPDDQIYNPEEHICGCWRGKESVHVSE